MKKKVVVGMSGGVDSSVAAWLLKEQGYEVIGVTLQMEAEASCALSAAEDAKKVAETLGIPHYVADFSQEFQDHVKDYFVGEYLQGRTPNPCIVCNRHVKWEALLKFADSLGAGYIGTGHYARIDRLANGRYAIRNSVTAAKDQTYALYRLSQEQLSRTLMPVGEYSKEEIRKFAQEQGLPVAQKPDSQEICFVPDDDYAAFVEREAEGVLKRKGAFDRESGLAVRLSEPGNFVTADGEVLGRHEGIVHYTLGQRRGLRLPMGRRVFVTGIRPETNEVVIGENQDLFTTKVLCDSVHYMAMEALESPRRAFSKIRYNHKGEYCTLSPQEDGRVLCVFEKPVRAATPGQAVVFYDGEYVLGGGTIL